MMIRDSVGVLSARLLLKAQRPVRRGAHAHSVGVIAAILATACLGIAALGYVGFLLWPRWPDAAAAPDAPTMPISVNGVVFNVPPGSVRVAMQRRPGAQVRLDLTFMWPDLTAPTPHVKPVLSDEPKPADQVFVSIVAAEERLTLDERLRTIYPRYAESNGFKGPEGLIGIAFRDGTPYHGEDLFFAAEQPNRFIVRCTRAAGATPGTCLYEKRIETTDLTARIPRDWLDDWQKVSSGMERLIGGLRASAH
jgi:hypothetical protein